MGSPGPAQGGADDDGDLRAWVGGMCVGWMGCRGACVCGVGLCRLSYLISFIIAGRE